MVLQDERHSLDIVLAVQVTFKFTKLVVAVQTTEESIIKTEHYHNQAVEN